jgi:hypothetical protein
MPAARRSRAATSTGPVAEQTPSGFFEHCAFRNGQHPFTHTIAYTARGLLESGFLLEDPRYRQAAERCARAMLPLMRDDGHLPSTVTTAGAGAATSCCLTGNCQFAIVWARLHAVRRPSAFSRRCRARARLRDGDAGPETSNPDVRGAIKGSQPVWGRYAPMSFPNWATKFFVDAMWLRRGFPA